MNQRLEHHQAPERLVTERFTLRRPRSTDAAAILQSYAGDPEVTRLLAWPRHRSIEDTLSFIKWSDQAWGSTPAGPYLILDREDRVLGTTGLDVETPWRAATGYVLRRDAWGRGLATEVTVRDDQARGRPRSDPSPRAMPPRQHRVRACPGRGRLPSGRCAPPSHLLPERRPRRAAGRRDLGPGQSVKARTWVMAHPDRESHAAAKSATSGRAYRSSRTNAAGGDPRRPYGVHFSARLFRAAAYGWCRHEPASSAFAETSRRPGGRGRGFEQHPC